MDTGLILESHLTSVEVILCRALTHGSISDSTESIRGRGAKPTIHFTEKSMVVEIDSVLDFHVDEVFAVREIPALRFDSDHGSLVIADLWGDTRYRPLTGAKGRSLLNHLTPLITIAEAAKQEASQTPHSQVVIAVIGAEETEVLKPRHRLVAYSSFRNPEVGDFRWADDENNYKATDARAVKRNYRSLPQTKRDKDGQPKSPSRKG